MAEPSGEGIGEGAAPAALAATQPAALPKDFLDHVKKINDVFYDQIKIADQKAAYIFTFMIAFLVTSAEGRGVFKSSRYLAGDPFMVPISALLAIATTVSLGCAIMVVLPRRLATTTSLFWGAWARHRAEFIDAARRGDDGYLLAEYLANVDNLAIIAASKYKYVGYAFRFLLVTVVSYVALLALG